MGREQTQQAPKAKGSAHGKGSTHAKASAHEKTSTQTKSSTRSKTAEQDKPSTKNKENGGNGHHNGHTKTAGEAKGSNPHSPAKIQKLLGGIDYPAQKQQILDKARAEGADQEVMSLLEQLPDREYTGPVGISKELGKLM